MADRTALAVLNCNDCGACCMHVGAPPGLYFAYVSPEDDGVWLTKSEDWRIWQAIPETLQQSLRDYYAAVNAGGVDRVREKMACLWYDAETLRCRHYDHRPQNCRDFGVGEEDCLAVRQLQGIDP
jgi:Fe-S-cluster containining protein